MRARLIASGILRYHSFRVSSVKELNDSVEILGEELSRIKASDVVMSIREAVERVGLKVPDLSPAVQAELRVELGSTGMIGDGNGAQTETSKPVPFRYVRRANNQVSEPLEMAIRDLLDRGWTKSAIAKAVRVNRRVVIRVAREIQSAHKNERQVSNDLGKS